MRRLLNNRYLPVVVFLLIAGLVTGVVFATNSNSPTGQQNQGGPNPSIFVLNWDKIPVGQPALDVVGGGFTPGEPVLIKIVITTSVFGEEPMILGSETANSGGAFRFHLDKLPVQIEQGVYSVVAQSTDGVRAAWPLIVTQK